MQSSFSRLVRCLSRADLLLGLLLALALSSCNSTSTPKIEGVPSDLPNIPLYGQARTPGHNMPHSDYPFDSNGNYVTSWAAEGGTSAGPSDYQRSHQPDRDDPPSRKSSSLSSARKVSSDPPARKSSVQVASSSKKKSDSPPSKKSSDAPKSKSSSTASTPAKKSSSGGGGSTKHVVKSSDTLYSIARKYGSSVAKIKEANGLKGDSIRDGTTLTIPR